MNITILLIYIILGGLIQAVRMLADECKWLGLKTAKIPYFKAGSISLTIIFVLVGISHQVITEIEKHKYSLFLDPKHIYISPGFSKIKSIKIVNNKDFPIYQIGIKIAVESGDLSVDDVNLKPKDESKLESDIGGVTVSHDVFGIGVITNEGKRENHIYIYDVDAHSTKELIANINANNMRKKSKVVFEIVRTDKKSADIVSFDPFISCQSDDHDFKTYHETSKMMLNQKRYKEALICCDKALLKEPRSAKVHSNKGVALLFLNEREKAINEFEASIDSDPKLATPYMNLAGILMQQSKFDDAIKLLKLVVGLNEDKQIDALVLWGQCLALQSDNDGAIEKYKKAIELRPDCGPAYFRWGLIQKNEGNYENAIVKFQKATEYEHPFKLDSYGMWGACLEKLGEHHAAIDMYRKIIKIAPNSTEAKKSINSIEILKKKIRDKNAK